jgi:hypothetical protein
MSRIGLKYCNIQRKKCSKDKQGISDKIQTYVLVTVRGRKKTRRARAQRELKVGTIRLSAF